jgi:hypothetical protein
VQGGVDGAAEDGDHLQLGIELDLVDGGASRRVFEGDDEPAVADQQRDRAQARGDAVAELAQRLGLDRERFEVDQRIAHLAGERGLQLVARDHAHPHQDLAERDAAVELLLHERFLQLALVDHAEREQRLADPNERHLLLALDRLEQLLRSDDLLRDQDLAELLLAQALLHVDRLVDLCRRRADPESTSTSPIFGPSSKAVYAARGMNVRLTLPSSSQGGKMNRPNSVSTWPIVMPLSSPPR